MAQQYTNYDLAQMVVALTGNVDRNTTPKIMNAIQECPLSIADYYAKHGSLKGLDVSGVGKITRDRLGDILKYGFEGVQQRYALNRNYRRLVQNVREPCGGGWLTTHFTKKIDHEQDEPKYLK